MSVSSHAAVVVKLPRCSSNLHSLSAALETAVIQLDAGVFQVISQLIIHLNAAAANQYESVYKSELV